MGNEGMFLSPAIQCHLCGGSSGAAQGVGETARGKQTHSGGPSSGPSGPRPLGCSTGKEVAALVGFPQRVHSQVSVSPAPATLPLPTVSPTSLLHPRPAVWDEKNLLFRIFAITMKAFLSPFLRIHLCIPEGAFITPCPGCRRLPPSDPPAEKGSLVRHMKPAPLDIWTRHSPLAEHEAVLNASDSQRRALVPSPNGPNKWTQLGIEGAVGVGGERSQAFLAGGPRYLHRTI